MKQKREKDKIKANNQSGLLSYNHKHIFEENLLFASFVNV